MASVEPAGSRIRRAGWLVLPIAKRTNYATGRITVCPHEAARPNREVQLKVLEARLQARQVVCKLVVAVSLALAAPHLRGEEGLERALRRTNLAAPFDTRLAIADFDNDAQPDVAVLMDSAPFGSPRAFRLELHLTAGVNSTLTFESAETAHTVSAWDVDNDQDTDVVVGRGFNQGGLYVWLNDGHGSFHKGRIEDFPAAANPPYDQVRQPRPDSNQPLLSRPPQRGSGAAILTAHGCASLASSSEDCERCLNSSLAICRRPSHNSPRAPPAFHSF